MMSNDVMTRWPISALLLLLPALPACGHGGGGDSGGGGGTDDGGTGTESGDGADDESGEPEPPVPDPHGDQCGSEVRGWQTGCFVHDVVGEASDRGEIPGIPAEESSTARTLCCEGQPSVETADAGCQDYCLFEVCEAARVDHINRCGACLWPNCGFDFTNCTAGGAHTQIVACVNPGEWDSYTLTASCTATNNEVRNPDGTFHFLEQPLNDTTNDPLTCNVSENLEREPPHTLKHYIGSASEGTLARLSWSMGDLSGEERSEDLDVRFEYAVLPCAEPTTDCLELAALELTLPPTTALGLTITQARLSVVSVEEAPVVERGEDFQLADGAFGVLMQAQVDGVPLVLSGTNVGTARGRISSSGDQFSISDLRFQYADSVFTAALDIDIQGRYDDRRPNAQITRGSAPERCDEPVTLLATSWDADQDPLTHTWWVRGIGSFSGPLLELPLPAGEHTVMLTTGDDSGLFDSETLRYARKCQ